MPRDSALLYRNHKPSKADAPHYRGVLKLQDGQFYWCSLWVRQIKGERALELKLTPKGGQTHAVPA
jgi:hypothetical protein